VPHLHSRSLDFEIQVGRDVAACDDAVRLQREIWGDAAVVPSNMLLASIHVGAYLAIARVAGEAVGFVYSIYGVTNGRPIHHSHMLAVRPSHRGSPIARALKAAQRDHCLAQGIQSLTWTMDPLESRNGRFNLAKLGAYATEYHEDFYGAMRDKLNVGLPSDRFIVEWPIATTRVEDRLTDRSRPPSLADCERSTAWALAADNEAPGAERAVDDAALVAVPWDFRAIKARDPALARAWREAHRRTLGTALRGGATVTEHLIDGQRAAYLVVRHAAA
jgi:predicted GNAT superfamily acetyltransferase